MHNLESVLSIAWMLAVAVAGIAHIFAKVKATHLAGVQLIAAVADEAVREIEQMRKARVKGMLPDLTPGEAQEKAVQIIMRQLDISDKDAASAVEAAVTKLPKSNLATARDASGRFASPAG